MSYRPNFKTDVHRTQTKKWADAKPASYDADDWGDDDYGYDYEEPPPMPKATGLRQRGQAATSVDTTRSFTSPEQNTAAQIAAQSAAAPQLQRSSSYEVGDEYRNFSAGPDPPSAGFGNNPLSAPVMQQAYAADAAHSQHFPGQEVSYSSLNTLQEPGDEYASPGGHIRNISNPPLEPPRKSSRRKPSPEPPILSTPAPTQNSSGALYDPQPMSRAPEQEQPSFTFIRPADIYKRIEAERERERSSMDSSRPSTESASRSTRDAPSAAATTAAVMATSSTASAQPAVTSPYEASTRGRQPDLSPVAERFSGYGSEGQQSRDLSHSQQGSADSGHMAVPSLPQLGRVSGFGSDFLNFSSSFNNPPTAQEPEHESLRQATTRSDTDRTLSPGDQQLREQPSLGFRSAVEHAFDGSDDNFVTSPRSTQGSQRSTAENSDVTRTDSTADISPIMSNVPSAALAARRAAERDELVANAPPTIAEESGSPPNSRPVTGTIFEGGLPAPSTPTGNHARNVSAESATTPVPSNYRRDMRPPSRNNSPARALAIETRSLNSRTQPEVGAVASPTDPQSQSASIQGPESDIPDSAAPDSAIPDSAVTASSKYTDREADVAEAINYSSGSPSQDLAVSARAAPDEFMSSPHEYEDVARYGSPFQGDSSMSKGRVKNLANQYDEIHHSRSQSPVGSVSSRNDNRPRIQTDHSSGSVSPNVDSAGAASGQTSATATAEQDEPHLRPSLPGGWISYAGTEASNADESRDLPEAYGADDASRGLDVDDYQQHTEGPAATPDEEVDLSPNTTKRVLPGHTLDDDGSSAGPMAAVAAAGTAMAASLVAAAGLGKNDSEEDTDNEPQTSRAVPQDDTTSDMSEETPDLDHLRPQPLHKANRSFDSSAGPTPPAKDTPRGEASGSEYFAPPAPLKDQQYGTSRGLNTEVEGSRLPSASHMSIESSAEDTENDRLAKDIVRNLTPAQSPVDADRGFGTLGLSDSQAADTQRASSVLPREYDSYWAGSPARSTFNVSPLPNQQPSTMATGDEFRTLAVAPPLQKTPSPKPGLIGKRFSWEVDDDEEDLNQPTQSAQGLQPAPLSPVTVKRDLDSSPQELMTANEIHETPTQASPTRGDSLAPPAEIASSSMFTETRGLGVTNTSPTSPTWAEPRPIHYSPPREAGGDAIGPSAKSSAEYSSRDMSRPSTNDFTDNKPLPGQAGGDLTGYRQTSQLPASSTTTGGAPSMNVLPLKDIMGLKSSDGRVESCRSSREQLAAADTGLSDWLTFMIASNPAHANAVASGVQRPSVTTSGGIAGSVRNKLPVSLSKLTKTSPSSPSGPQQQQQQQPYYQQYLDSAATVPGQSPTTTGLSSVPESRPATSSSPSTQSKGSDALKGFSKGAKGLFAKGKSRFKTPQSEG